MKARSILKKEGANIGLPDHGKEFVRDFIAKTMVDDSEVIHKLADTLNLKLSEVLIKYMEQKVTEKEQQKEALDRDLRNILREGYNRVCT